MLLESDIYNPVYKYDVQVQGDVPADSLVVVKIYTLHSITGYWGGVYYTIDVDKGGGV